MSEVVFVALLSLFGTLAGTAGGIIVASRLTSYRIGQLEIKVDKHNSLIERTYRIESDICDHTRRIKSLEAKTHEHRTEDE